MSQKKSAGFTGKDKGAKNASVPLTVTSVPTPANIYKPKTILHKSKPVDYTVFYEDKDVTPKPLDSSIFQGPTVRREGKAPSIINISRIETSTTELNVFRSSSQGRFKTEIMGGAKDYISFMGSNMEDGYMESMITEGSEEERPDVEEEGETEDKAQMRDKPIEHVSLVLVETETDFLLELPSYTVLKDSPEGKKVEEDNDNYKYLTEGKGRNRKTVLAMVQTNEVLRKCRDTEADKIKFASCGSFASVYDMYDTYKAVEEEEVQKAPVEVEKSYRTLKEVTKQETMSSDEKQMIELMGNLRFRQATCVIERLLANNAFNKQQKIFKGLSDYDPDSITEYKYTMRHLWTFANAKTQGKPITAMAWNVANEDIMAVGYGKFFFQDKHTGMVFIWNIKNPVQPEREYFFEEDVVSLAFATTEPNLLAIGFNFGILRILDISRRYTSIICQISREDSESFEPVNVISFYTGDEHCNYEEQVLACFNGGRVCKYRVNVLGRMPCTQIMRVTVTDGKIKGIESLKTCGVPSIPITKFAGATAIALHPADPYIYYVTTTTGVIHTCSTNYFNQHLDLLAAHQGPVYSMEFSPFCNKLYLTCGADWTIRLWAEGITEPLVELATVMLPVERATWSPTHSSIIVSIQGTNIVIWDLHRKTHAPQNTIKSPTNSRNTICKFTHNGRCVIVGDIDGNVHVYSLEDLPIKAFFQDELLQRTLKKVLNTNPVLLKKFEALKSLNFEKRENHQH